MKRALKMSISTHSNLGLEQVLAFSVSRPNEARSMDLKLLVLIKTLLFQKIIGSFTKILGAGILKFYAKHQSHFKRNMSC